MDFQSCEEHLTNHAWIRNSPTLEHMERLLKRIGNPHLDMNCIQIGGTNGKGSTSALCASVLQEAGHNVGLFTTPHLLNRCERIKVNSHIISEKKFIQLYNQVAPSAQNNTVAEITLAIALLYFKEKKVTHAVIEITLGGTWDASNAITPVVNAITNVSLDHQHILGNTIEKIAQEKAGIAKKDVPLVTTAHTTAFEVIQHQCNLVGTKCIRVDTYEGELPLKGSFQKKNAAIAYKIGQLLNIDENIITKGLANTQWSGRIQYLTDNFIVDGAHNPAGLKELVRYVTSQQYEKLWIVFGVSTKKDSTQMMQLLPHQARIITTKSRHKSAATLTCGDSHFETSEEAFDYVTTHASPKDLIVCCGSLHLIAEALRYHSNDTHKNL